MVDSLKAGNRVLSALLLLLATLPVAAGQAATTGPHPPIAGSVFVTSDQCLACHNGLTTPAGEDVSIGSDWRTSMMANAARDPYWQAAVRREITDHPESVEAIENECSACHMPMARYDAKAAGVHESVFAHTAPVAQTPHDLLAIDGVSCTMCHQISEERLGEEESFTAGFIVTTTVPPALREIYGGFEVDQGRQRIMSSATQFSPSKATHLQTSEVCATCHTLFTHSLGAGGKVIGSLPEQVPYLEWKHSAYAGTQDCQSCHMNVITHDRADLRLMGQPRSGVNRHVFRGGNFFMMRILNRYRDELGVPALPVELEMASMRTIEHLQSKAADLDVSDATVVDGRLEAEITIRNRAGHKLPTAYPSRRAWLHLTVRDASDEIVFESGAVNPDGSILGNANDADPRAFEPHYGLITEPGQVQIYETILADQDGEVTTGLLQGVRLIKDNRILPAGFDKGTAGADIAVQGEAFDDEDFGGGADRIRLSIPVSGTGPWSIDAELLYQPIGFRWAQNLREVDAMETRRFVRYFDEMSEFSWIVMARGGTTAD